MSAGASQRIMSLPTRPVAIGALAAVLFAVVTVVRFSLESVADGYALLYVLPIAVTALGFGLYGGVAGAAAAMALVFLWAQLDEVGLSLAGYVTRGIAFLLLGGLVGFEISQRHRLEADREQLLERLHALARTDELTGLPNRRAWDEELRREILRARRTGAGLAVVLLDLDRFKQFNDEHGHPGGDQLLRDAPARWRRCVREIDTIGRYGGEEFGVLLPNCPPGTADKIVDRLRGATPMNQTASAGIAYWDGTETAEELVGRADAALYEAKRRGRNRSHVAESPAPDG